MQRKQIGPMFTRGYLSEMEPVVKRCGIDALAAKWDKLILNSDGSITVNYYSDFVLAAFDIVCALGLGRQFSSLARSDSQVVQWVRGTKQLRIFKHTLPFATKFPSTLMSGQCVKRVDDFVDFGFSITAERHRLIQEGREPPKDILQAMLDAGGSTAMKHTASEITAITVGFLTAGATTGSALAWFMHCMLLYPDVYQKVTDEVRMAFACSHYITYAEVLSSLPYLTACIYESLRFHSATGILVPRVVPVGGTEIQGHFLPAGTIVKVNIAGLNHNKEVWGDPEIFRPERFIENESLKHSMLAFSTGVRICPGRNLASVLLYTTLANLLNRYDVKLPEDALWGPDNMDKSGNPIPMPRKFVTTVDPRYPERDCNFVISKRV